MTKFRDDLVRPFAALRPAPGRAAEVAAPPYDVMTTDEARELARDKPCSFLHVSRAEIDLPAASDPYSGEVYATAARNLDALEQSGVLIRDQAATFYVYRMTAGTRVQTGVALSASVTAYLENRIRRHELTRPTKEDDRVRQIDAVDAITGPVLLIYRADPSLAAALAQAAATPADAVVPDLDGVRHEIWVVKGEQAISHIGARLNQLDALYIADGHHRSAAAARIAATRRAANAAHDGSEAYNGFLAVGFPDDEVTILDYNRLVRDLNGQNGTAFLERLARDFDITGSDDSVRPQQARTFGMYLEGRWYTIKPRDLAADPDPVENLDVRILDRLVVAPMLGITDPRTDPRIDFIGGSRGLEALAARVDSGEMAVGFTLFPTSLTELMAVADANLIMPPKSTWFDPKLADGLISLPLN